MTLMRKLLASRLYSSGLALHVAEVVAEVVGAGGGHPALEPPQDRAALVGAEVDAAALADAGRGTSGARGRRPSLPARGAATSSYSSGPIASRPRRCRRSTARWPPIKTRTRTGSHSPRPIRPGRRAPNVPSSRTERSRFPPRRAAAPRPSRTGGDSPRCRKDPAWDENRSRRAGRALRRSRPALEPADCPNLHREVKAAGTPGPPGPEQAQARAPEWCSPRRHCRHRQYENDGE